MGNDVFGRAWHACASFIQPTDARWRRHLGLLGSLVLILAFAQTASAQPWARANRECFRPLQQSRLPDPDTLDLNTDAGRIGQIASSCGGAPLRPGAEYAYYYGGRAYRVLGEGPIDPRGAGQRDQAHLQQALRLLGLAEGIGRDSDPELARRARLEMVRANRLLGSFNPQYYGDAMRMLGDLIRDHRGQLTPELSYEEAMLRVAMQDGDRHAALQALTRTLPAAQGPPYLRLRGPLALVNLARQLARETLARPRTPETMQLALRLYTDAARGLNEIAAAQSPFGAEDVGAMYAQMGLLNLRLANAATPATTDLTCRNLNPHYLAAAERDFRSALERNNRSAEALFGMGCVARAIGARRDATELLRAAASLAPSAALTELRDTDVYLEYARAMADEAQRPEDWRNVYAQYLLASSRETDNTRRATILYELADHQVSQGDTIAADATLRDALALYSHPAALMLQGRVRLAQGDLPTARAALLSARRIAGPHQPEANYLLSQLEDRARAGVDAVRYATDAYLGDRGNLLYRHQACVLRLRYRLTAEQGLSYCAAEESIGRADDDRYPEWLPRYPDTVFYEGIFWLREAQRLRGGNQRTAWAQAIRVFEQGMLRIGGEQSTETLTDSINGVARPYNLYQLFAFGRRFALHCAGMEAVNVALPNDPQSENERQLFESYGIRQCWL